jgi:cytochrome P450
MSAYPAGAGSVTHVPGPTIDTLELNRRREECGIATSPRGFEIYRYDEGNALLRDPRFTKAEAWLYRLDTLGVTDGPVRESWERNLTTIEGEDRLRLRRSLSALLAPKQIRELQGVIGDIIATILDEIDDSTDVDLIGSICWKLPALVYCHLVGADPGEAATVARFSDSMLGPLFTENVSRREEHIAAHIEATEWAREQIRVKQQHLGSDFTSAMIRQQRDGVITDEELLQEVLILLTGSVDNTQNQAGIILGSLLQDTSRWRRLVSDPTLIPTAIEESIRLAPRFGTIFRQATVDVDLGGVEVSHGDFVFVSVRAAHRDPRVFDEPDEFIIDRAPKQPLMFGNGLYRCLGQHLARLEFVELLEAMTKRFPNAKLIGEWEMHKADAVTEVRRLRADLTGTAAHRAAAMSPR